MLTVSHECEHHADRQLPSEHQLGREEDDKDQLDTENEIIDRTESNFCAAQMHIGVRHFRVTVEPLSFPLAFAIEQLQTLNGAHGLDECRVFLCRGPNRGFCSAAV